MICFRPPRLLSAVALAGALMASAVAAATEDTGAADLWHATTDRPQADSIGAPPAESIQRTVHNAKHRISELVRHLDVVVFVAGGLVTVIVLLRRRKPVPPPESNHDWDLATPLIRWSQDAVFSIQDSFEHVLITGQTGSGKTSGSFRSIALEALKMGYGAIILLAKNDRDFWESLCEQAGRSSDLLMFGRNELRFNFLDYEMNRAGEGAGLTENIVKLFSTLMELTERSSGQGGREDEGYWRRACRQLCRNLVDLLALSVGKISVPDLHRLVISAPTSMEQVRSEEWRASSFCFQCLKEADQRPKTPRQQRDLEVVADYFLIEFAALSDKTRSVIVSTFSSLVDILGRGLLRDLFCGETNVTPEAPEHGSILIIDLPIKTYREIGVIAQSVWKFFFQVSIERRDIRQSPRPVMLFADEAQFTVTSHDMQFLSTCRSSRVAAVYATQNISNFYGALGGEQKGKAEADSIFGNLNLKIFHANGDPITNKWASELIGRTPQFYMNTSSGPQINWIADLAGMGGSPNSAGMSEHMELEVEPSIFSTLRTGGESNEFMVDSIVFQSGKTFPDTGRPWRFATFDQRS